MQRDYYEVLKVPKNASTGQIKSAYRTLALMYHPDRVPADLKKDAENIFKEIAEAYQVLSSPEQRKIYDEVTAGKAGRESVFRKEDFLKTSGADPDVQYVYKESLWSNFELDSKSKIGAVIVSALYLFLGFLSGGLMGLFGVLRVLIFPLACIFFGQEIGSFTGWFRVSITSPTPGPFIIFVGWVMLLMPLWFPLINYLCSL